MAAESKKFHLRVFDNYHYMDESEAYNHGAFDTYEDALIAVFSTFNYYQTSHFGNT